MGTHLRLTLPRLGQASTKLAISIAIVVALGAGVNLAVLSVVHNVFEGSRPYRDIGTLVVLENRGAYDLGVRKVEVSEMSWPDYRDAAARQRSLIALEGVFRPEQTVWDTGERVRSTWRVTVTPGLLSLLGIRAALGRTLSQADFQPGAPRVTLLTERLWRHQLASDRAVVGRVVHFDGLAFTVVGVVADDVVGFLQERKDFLDDAQQSECLVVPFVPGGEGQRERLLALNLENRGFPALTVVGRLRPNVGLPTAAQEFTAISRQLTAQNPDTNAGRSIQATGLNEWRTRAFAHMRPMLVLVSILALLVACASAVGLIASDAIRRQPEMAVRHALGASRPRLARLALRRAIGWTLPGGLLGLLFAWLALRWVALAVGGGDSALRLPFNAGVLLNVAGLTVGTSLTLGAIATWLLSRQDLALGLKEAGLTTSLGPSRRRALSTIVALQVAAATSLGLVSGLLLRSMTNIVNVDLGFDPGQSFFVRFVLPEKQYRTSEEQFAYFEKALARVRSHPGVASAGIAQSPPLSRAVVTLGGDLNLEVPGRSPENLAPLVGQYVTPGYFESLGVRMIRGRPFSDQDYRSSLPVVIVEDAFCRTRLSAADPLQAGVRMGGTLYRIIGVTRDLRPDGPIQKARPTLYILRGPGQRATFGHLVVRPTANPRDVAADAVKELLRIDPRVVIDEPQSMRDLVSKSVAHRRRTLQLLTLAAAVVLLLTGFSVSGALSQFVEHRTREIALRKALGSPWPRTLRLVVQYIAAPCSCGIVLGCFAGWFLAERLSNELFGLDAGDPLTIGVTVIAQVALGSVAAAGPLWRAGRIDPAKVLRGL